MNKSKIFAFFAAFFLSFSMLLVSDDAEAARRLGGGFSIGRQSSNIKAKPTTPIIRNDTTSSTAGATTAGTAARSSMPGAATQPRSGFSRFLAPIAGIAAGLGIAALLSSLGLSGVFLELLSSLVLIGLVIFGVMFILRRVRGVSPSTATAPNGIFKSGSHTEVRSNDYVRQPVATTTDSYVNTSEAATDTNWFIPAGFDTHAFLQEAKKQFIFIQSLWDAGDMQQLSQYLTDDLVREITPQITAQSGQHKTEVVLLNAELLGMEKIQEAGFDGHLASVRFSGMLREEANQPAFRFEEVWNLYKADKSGWLLAGIQQIPVND